MRHLSAILAAALGASALPSGAQTARLGSLPADTPIVTNSAAISFTQQMLDSIAGAFAALAATNAEITAGILARTNGWAQYDTLIQQSNATVRLYQPDTPLRWMWMTPTNPAITRLVPDGETTNTVTEHVALSSDLSAAATNEAALRAAGDAAGIEALAGTNAALAAAIHAATTNEAALREAGDAAGLSALAGTNAITRAALTNEAALREAGDQAGLAALNETNAILAAAIHAATTNEAALREAGDQAGLAALNETNAIHAAAIHAATTNEAALREAGDQAGLAAITTNRTTRLHDPTSTIWCGIEGGTNIIVADTSAWLMTVSDDWTMQGETYATFGQTLPWVIHPTQEMDNVFARGTETAAWSGSAFTQYTHSGGAIWIGSNTLSGTSGSGGTVFFNPSGADHPIARYLLRADYATTGHVEQVKELHSDSYTNLIWRSVYSNGWHWLIAYTNTPGGGAE